MTAKKQYQVEGLKMHPSCQDAVEIDGEAVEFEWNIFPGFSSLALLQEIQEDLARKNIKHSVNQLSIYGAVANWCHQFGPTEKEKVPTNLSVDNKMLTCVPSNEVQLLLSPPTMAPIGIL